MYQAILFLPLIGALIVGLFGRVLGPRPSELVTYYRNRGSIAVEDINTMKG